MKSKKSIQQLFEENVFFLNDMLRHFEDRLKKAVNEEQREFCKSSIKTIKESKQIMIKNFMLKDELIDFTGKEVN